MGVLKFRLPAGFPASLAPEVATAYVTGLDRMPEQRVAADVRGGLLTVRRERMESGRLLCPWPVPGFGLPIVSTATLAERGEPYDLALELARGKLNDVSNQAAEWIGLGLKAPEALAPALTDARRAFTRAATRRDDPEAAAREAEASLAASHRSADALVAAYTQQVLARRLEHAPTLPTLLACGLDGLSKTTPWYYSLAEGLNAGRVRCDWRAVAPEEGQFRWEGVDYQVHWCRKRKLAATLGPLLDLRPSALPHWLWLWEG